MPWTAPTSGASESCVACLICRPGTGAASGTVTHLPEPQWKGCTGAAQANSVYFPRTLRYCRYGKRHSPSRKVASSSDQTGSGGRIRTCDLRVMSPTSYRTAPPRAVCRERIRIPADRLTVKRRPRQPREALLPPSTSKSTATRHHGREPPVCTLRGQSRPHDPGRRRRQTRQRTAPDRGESCAAAKPARVRKWQTSWGLGGTRCWPSHSALIAWRSRSADDAGAASNRDPQGSSSRAEALEHHPATLQGETGPRPRSARLDRMARPRKSRSTTRHAPNSTSSTWPWPRPVWQL